jgi:hypothetical protein
MCRTSSLNDRLRRKHSPHPSETGLCRKRLHPFRDPNLYYDTQGQPRCIACRDQAKVERKQRTQLIRCIVKECKRLTRRSEGGTYICPKHRKSPPPWIKRLGLQIVGTQILN